MREKSNFKLYPGRLGGVSVNSHQKKKKVRGEEQEVHAKNPSVAQTILRGANGDLKGDEEAVARILTTMTAILKMYPMVT